MKKKILITDDDPGVQDILKIIFEQAGYEVDINEDPRTILNNDFSIPDVFLVDKQLSGVDGLDVCRHLKSRGDTKDIPLIMISATPGLSALARDAGADDCLEKPFRKKDLLDIVAKYIGEPARI
jgi:DNA-binding response OmpR family regulator